MVKKACFGLIGKGISHSFSAAFFNRKFREEHIDAEYLNFDIEDISKLSDIIRGNTNLRGLNVTSPYKRAVIPFLSHLSEDAKEMNAVNVIEIMESEDGERMLKGHNTDCEGFMLTLAGLSLEGEKALILGTGGASSAVAMALKKLGVPFLKVSRSPSANEIDYEMASTLLETHRLIINATPVGMYPKIECVPAIDFGKISTRHICYDLIYNPEETIFLKNARKRGARAYNGLQMLKNQAMLAWNIWNKRN